MKCDSYIKGKCNTIKKDCIEIHLRFLQFDIENSSIPHGEICKFATIYLNSEGGG